MSEFIRKGSTVCWHKASDEIILKLKIKPNAKRSECVAIKDQRLQVRIAAPAIDGKANVALIKFLSKQLKTPQSSITIKSGSNNSLKTLTLPRSTEDSLVALLQPFIRT
jgi:hypothetical protein